VNIYFACSIVGGRQDESIYDRIARFLLAAGHEVPSAVFAFAGGEGDENVMTASQVFARDTRWIDECEVLIAEVSTPSHGVGFEIGYALNLGKPVVCVYQMNSRVSKMLLGNPHPKLQTMEYENWNHLRRILPQILNET